ncbi:ribosome biogenesis protein Nop16 [Gautieria morchelliformis]|nr:ribosome biogenesis protein Nop16 [Gautieria morchelliformis]
MGNPRQRRKARSSAHKTVKPSRHAKRNLRKMKPIRGPKALQDAWDNKKTLRQNYATLGLVGSLKQADSGGSEYPLPMAATKPSGEVSSSARPKTNIPKEETMPQKYGKILRDADGSVIGVEMFEEVSELEGDDDEGDGERDPKQSTDVVNALERLAESSRPVTRVSSIGEIASLRKLIAKHGYDFGAMAKDRRLNGWQRTAGQLERASKKAGLV